MKSIFLIEKKGDDAIRPVTQIYTDNIVARLRDEAGLISETYINRSNLPGHLPEAREAEAAFSTWNMPAFSKEEIAAYFPNLRAVFYSAGSVKSFAHPFLERGVRVFSAYAANAVPVAEFCAAQIVLANKGFFQCCKPSYRADYALAAARFSHCPGNYGARVGLLGAGAVGRLVIQYLAPYRLELFVYDPFLSDEEANTLGVTKASLETVFQSCSVVSNHLADVPETRGIINGDLLARMPSYSTFLNTGRGAQVDEGALIQKLKSDPTFTALLDVTDPEPPEDASPLYHLPNVYLTPHMAGSSGRELVRMAEYMLEEFHRFQRGEPAKYEVTLKMLEKMA
ncbi:MAG TPA: hydroxyacid dehydrogenase [Candidatus Aphodoplasma excrementigallinarum]|uniref:Hydroxyacid dehydrogenase n=1 Tax=Candidatus Aphodoplasma excrementigallinarum TaxID=2840673 RepID=A0A9D1NGG9_9FIRM|nr:hydroxyacid dehydrogenase [Candidatus Aphodoplasma excrementigallinarum]